MSGHSLPVDGAILALTAAAAGGKLAKTAIWKTGIPFALAKSS